MIKVGCVQLCHDDKESNQDRIPVLNSSSTRLQIVIF